MTMRCYGCTKEVIPTELDKDCVYLCADCSTRFLEGAINILIQILKTEPIENPYGFPFYKRKKNGKKKKGET
jgi:hypothetical protein